MNLIRCVLGCVLCISLSGCCTMSQWAGMGKKDAVPLTIESSVPGAEVYIKGKLVGYTPYSHFGKYANVRKITVKKTGYKDMTLKTRRKLKPAIYWNFMPLYTFIWGYFVDRSKGTGKKYTNDYYYFNLQEK